jgi:hypothetical protein
MAGHAVRAQRKLHKDLQKQGFEVTVTRKGHLLICDPGTGERGMVSSSRSEYRGQKNDRAVLRRLGANV